MLTTPYIKHFETRLGKIPPGPKCKCRQEEGKGPGLSLSDFRGQEDKDPPTEPEKEKQYHERQGGPETVSDRGVRTGNVHEGYHVPCLGGLSSLLHIPGKAAFGRFCSLSQRSSGEGGTERENVLHPVSAISQGAPTLPYSASRKASLLKVTGCLHPSSHLASP